MSFPIERAHGQKSADKIIPNEYDHSQTAVTLSRAFINPAKSCAFEILETLTKFKSLLLGL